MGWFEGAGPVGHRPLGVNSAALHQLRGDVRDGLVGDEQQRQQVVRVAVLGLRHDGADLRTCGQEHAGSEVAQRDVRLAASAVGDQAGHLEHPHGRTGEVLDHASVGGEVGLGHDLVREVLAESTPLDQRGGGARVVLAQQRHEEVRRVDLAVTALVGDATSGLQQPLGLRREASADVVDDGHEVSPRESVLSSDTRIVCPCFLIIIEKDAGHFLPECIYYIILCLINQSALRGRPP